MTESFESTSFSPADAPLPVLPDEAGARPTSDVAPEHVASGLEQAMAIEETADKPADPDPDPVDPDPFDPEPTTTIEPSLADLQRAMEQLTAEVSRHHDRAVKREEIIDRLHAESERLRVGERRSTIRPLLLAISRLRDDLLRQSRTLPTDFDGARGEKLLRSFATAIEITLDDYSVGTFTPSEGEPFDPRRHRAISSQPAPEAALAKTIAEVRRDGYEDIEAGVTLSRAEVTVYSDPVPETPESSIPSAPASGSDAQPTEPAPSVD